MNRIRVVPANLASWDDLKAIFGERGDPHRCQCQRFRMPSLQWHTEKRSPARQLFRERQFREQTNCGDSEAAETTGLVAYRDGEPVGWCAVAPRNQYVFLGQTPWKERQEDPAEEGIWAVTCFVVRVGFRKQGISKILTRAAVDYARECGAKALEGYAMRTVPGQEITWGELHVGSLGGYTAAGFAEVSHPSSRRVVMRIEFRDR